MELYKSKGLRTAELPRPEQMFKLAAAVVCLARDQGKKKASSQVERAHILLPNKLETRVEDDEGQYTHHVTHRFTGRIGRIGYRRWSMRMTEPYWVNSEEETSSYRSFFAFEWTDKDVVMASKRVAVDMSELDEDPVPDYGLQPATIDPAIFQPDLVNAVSQNEIVSAADCDRLIDDVREFGAASVRALQYNR